MRKMNRINVNDLDLSWDIKKGQCFLADIPVALMWIDSTLLGLMSSVEKMVGTERFLLSLQLEGKKSVEHDWEVISSYSKFEAGFNEIAKVAIVAGWGVWSIVEYNKESKTCTIRVENSWEGSYQKTLGLNWGSGFVSGKFAGYCTKLFDTECWSTQASYIANGDAYDEFIVAPSTKTIDDEIEKLLINNRATNADMAVALEKLRLEVEQHKLTVKKLTDQEQYYESLFTNLNLPTFVINNEHKVVIWNKACERLTGLKASDVIGTNEHWRGFYKKERPCLSDLILNDSLDEIAEYYEFESTPFMPNGKRIQSWCQLPNGNDVFLDKDAVPILDSVGNITAVIEVLRDMTQQAQATDKLNYQASHDDLTGLTNRREFENKAKQLLSRVKVQRNDHALCYMDLDQFKIVNDIGGHLAGDEMLRQLSQALKTAVKEGDTLARLGGDEFGVLLENCSLESAEKVAKRLQKIVQDYQLIWEGQSFRVGVSIGLISVNENTQGLTEMLINADIACYMAKDLGRNRIYAYHTENEILAQTRRGEMRWVSRIQEALEDDRFCLYAQAITPLSGKVSKKHYELLLRMIDENGEVIPPGAFLPAAERFNLMVKIDRWVINRVFNDLANNSTFLEEINFVSINLSGHSITEEAFLEYIIDKLKETGIYGTKICFEITETAAISNITKAKKFIRDLSYFGCQFALDDFGSGLSSFGYLKQLPVNYLKIDGMFVKDILEDKIDYAMVKSINEIAQTMGMKTIAEFVESDEIKSALSCLGVNYGQGYGIEKPKPFTQLLNAKIYRIFPHKG